MRKDSNLLFCYGTLKSGFHNHHQLAESKFIGSLKTAAEFTMVDLGDYPAVIEHGSCAIHGEIYKIRSHTLLTLDKLEGYPHYFHRILISSSFGFVWMYVLNQAASYDKPMIKSGRWLKK
jgi:gamma-glutamylaminecyclotransferase